MRAEDVRETQHIKAFPHRKTPSCTADTDCLTTWCLFGVSTFKTVDYERARYTFPSATKTCSTALSATLDYLMVVINYCSKMRRSILLYLVPDLKRIQKKNINYPGDPHPVKIYLST